MRKVKAFTIIELLVVLALSALVILIAWQAWFIISDRFQQYERSTDAYLELKSLETSIAKDIHEARYLLREDDGFLLQFEDDLLIRYSFNSSLVSRIRNEADRMNFEVEVEEYHGMFNALEKDFGVIDELEISFQLSENVFNYYFYKRYSARDLIELYEFKN